MLGERAESFQPSSRKPLTHPTPFLPMGLGARGGPGPPPRLGRGYGTGCRGEVVVSEWL